jgi:16S rRNA (guanine527-N7)-methyltransferase
MSSKDLEDWEAFVERHILDSLSVTPELTRIIEGGQGQVLDLGSGAGFPGLPLKLFFPSVNITFLESTKKKAAFLSDVLKALDLDTSVVICDRAENLGQNSEHRSQYDVVVSRAVAPLQALLELTLPLCRYGGSVISMKGKKAQFECAASVNALSTLGGRLETVIKVDQLLPASEGELVIVRKINETPLEYPRRPGVPLKSPL